MAYIWAECHFHWLPWPFDCKAGAVGFKIAIIELRLGFMFNIKPSRTLTLGKGIGTCFPGSGSRDGQTKSGCTQKPSLGIQDHMHRHVSQQIAEAPFAAQGFQEGRFMQISQDAG